MSRTRKRVAIAQAVLSVALLLVVYLTLLRPDSGNEPLVAVEARQGNDFNADASFPASDAERRDGGGEGEDEDEVIEGPATQAGEAGAPPTATQDRLGLPADEPPPGTSPPDDQYGDAVSRLLGRLGAPD